MNNSYLKRYEENISSAELLIYKHMHYCSSIHCSYYAVFQILLLVHKKRDTQVYRNKNKLDRAGSHETLINGTFDILEAKDPIVAGVFFRNMGNLKNNRKISDYDETHIDKARSVAVFEMAQKLITLLTKELL